MRQRLNGAYKRDVDVINSLIDNNLREGISMEHCSKILRIWFKVVEPFPNWLENTVTAAYARQKVRKHVG